MNILLLASHAVAEYDDIRMFTDLGYDVFCPGGYQNPRESGEGLRPAIGNAAYHPDLVEACEEVRRGMGDPGQYIDWAKAKLHPKLIDWADVIICHHFPEQWLAGQWGAIRHKRVIWRTCGQSNSYLETVMAELREDGLQIVRYSPAERRYFESVGTFAGEDALIRFGKYPADYGPWTGEVASVGNITQHMAQRGDACGVQFWRQATAGLPTEPAGPGSEALGGPGALSYPAMVSYLRSIRAYLYTGTRPASYTLGLIEAMLSGVAVVAMGPANFEPDGLYEAHELLPEFLDPMKVWFNDPADAHTMLESLVEDRPLAAYVGAQAKAKAKLFFDVAKVGPQWQEFLS